MNEEIKESLKKLFKIDFEKIDDSGIKHHIGYRFSDIWIWFDHKYDTWVIQLDDEVKEFSDLLDVMDYLLQELIEKYHGELL
jgi:hypothetical protein